MTKVRISKEELMEHLSRPLIEDYFKKNLDTFIEVEGEVVEEKCKHVRTWSTFEGFVCRDCGHLQRTSLIEELPVYTYEYNGIKGVVNSPIRDKINEVIKRLNAIH